MSDKKRVDVALVERGLAQSREKAQALVMSGVVYIGENKVDKASMQVTPEDELIVRQTGTGYVSRGALKLEKGLAVFGVEAKERVAMDLGASTGGFTDVLLQNGAAHVYAIDVGYGQLDWKLRNDPRVTVMERTNARYLTADDLPLKPTLGVMDVSFISITKILPAAAAIMGEDGEFISLIKPQFEAGREKVGKKGVVRDPAVHLEVLEVFLRHAKENHFTACPGIVYTLSAHCPGTDWDKVSRVLVSCRSPQSFNWLWDASTISGREKSPGVPCP